MDTRTVEFAQKSRVLLDSLQEGLADGFTPELERAWAEAYDALDTSVSSAGVSLAYAT